MQEQRRPRAPARTCSPPRHAQRPSTTPRLGCGPARAPAQSGAVFCIEQSTSCAHSFSVSTARVLPWYGSGMVAIKNAAGSGRCARVRGPGRRRGCNWGGGLWAGGVMRARGSPRRSARRARRLDGPSRSSCNGGRKQGVLAHLWLARTRRLATGTCREWPQRPRPRARTTRRRRPRPTGPPRAASGRRLRVRPRAKADAIW